MPDPVPIISVGVGRTARTQFCFACDCFHVIWEGGDECWWPRNHGFCSAGFDDGYLRWLADNHDVDLLQWRAAGVAYNMAKGAK